jgi:hypothetical protein
LDLSKYLRSLACTNIIENGMTTARRLSRNVKRWQGCAAPQALCRKRPLETLGEIAEQPFGLVATV